LASRTAVGFPGALDVVLAPDEARALAEQLQRAAYVPPDDDLKSLVGPNSIDDL